MKTTYALLVAGFASQQVAATWNFFDNYGTPNYSNNQCSDRQKGGFDWSDLNDGDVLGNYGDFDFSGGWKCSNSFGKRDSLTKRTFSNKCIKNTVSKEKPASFGCSKRGFSISHMDISAEFDAELELHYTMEDGSICKQRGSCSAGGSTLQNTQCGGAKSVQVYLGSHYTGSKDSCEIGFHNIGFDCTPETPYTTPTPPKAPSTSLVQYPSSAPKPTPTPASPPASECGLYGLEDCSTPVRKPTGGSCEGDNCYAVSTPEASTSVSKTPATSAPQIPISSSAPFTNTSTPVFSLLSSTTLPPQPKISSVAVPTTVQSSATPGCGYGQSCDQSSVAISSAVPNTATSLPAIRSPSPSSPAASSSVPQPSSPSYAPVNITDAVPKCMNSWLQISASGCKDNTDSKCYCVKPEFTKNVIDCLTARCGNDDDTRKALQYFIGICAEHIPENPKIVGDCPSYIPLNPSPAAPTGGASAPVRASSVPAAAESSYVAVPPAPSAPARTPAITSAAASAPAAPPAEQTPCTTITYGTTTLTVPQVHFTTQPNTPGATPTQPVALVPGTVPAQTSAATTPAGGAVAPYPTPTTMGTATVPFGSGTGAIRPSSPAQFTGAASPLSVVPKGAMFGAVLALFAL